MNRFAELLDRLSYTPGRNDKLTLIVDYFRHVPDPDRGYALAAMTGTLDFRHAKPALIRGLIEERTDPALFRWSRDYVGDTAETIALMWPARRGVNRVPDLSEIVETLERTSKLEMPGRIAGWLDALDETGRWALLKLITGAMRIGVSARLAKQALAQYGGLDVAEVEEVWHGLKPPYLDLFAWADGLAPRPAHGALAPFRPVMLAHPVEEADFARMDPADYRAEWKWDGIRVQAVAERGVKRLYSRTGEDVSHSFPDLVEAMRFEGAVDGELLVVRGGAVAPFADLQQRLNRKTVGRKQLAEFPAGLRVYDLLVEDGEDLRPLPFDERRARLEAWAARLDDPRVGLSPLIPFADFADLADLRGHPEAESVEGVMLKRRDSPYLAGRPKGYWWKWKRDPFLVDAVLLYAQRGNGRRSSFYSDYTFGVWKDGALVPVGKAYFGFTDEELKRLDKFVRDNTVASFGPVREVAHEADRGLVLEVAFEGLQRSGRHKSGIAMRFPRINRIRWDKPPREADEIGLLERMLSG
jgi:DNA ligase-1